MSRSFLFSATFLCALIFAPAAQAQDQNTATSYNPGSFFGYGEDEEEEKPPIVNQYSDKYKKKLTEKDDGKPALLPQGPQYLYFVHVPGTAPGDATLRLVSPLSVNGCMNLVPPEITKTNSGYMIRVKIKNAEVALQDKPRYTNFDCDPESGYATSDIIFNREEMIANNTKQIAFQNEIAQDYYNVEISQDKLSLLPKTKTMFRPFDRSGKIDPLTYNFYPENTVVLFAPGAGKGDDVAGPIQRLALSSGLVDLDASLQNGGALYFVDQGGLLREALAASGSTFVGNISVPEIHQSANGPVEKQKELAVYARRLDVMD